MTVFIDPKTELVGPKSVRRKAGIKAGDQVEFQVTGRVINIIPKLPLTNETFTTDEEAQILKARKEMREGKFVTLAQLENELANKRPSRSRKTA